MVKRYTVRELKLAFYTPLNQLVIATGLVQVVRLLLLIGCIALSSEFVLAQTPARRGRTTPANSTTAPATDRRKAVADSMKAVAQERLDSLRAVKNAARRPTIRWQDRYTSRFSDQNPRSPYLLRDPKGLGTDFRMLPDKSVAINERLTPRPGVSTGVTNSNIVTVGPTPGAPTSQTSPVGNRPIGLPYRPGEVVPYSDFNRLQNERIEDRLFRDYAARRDGQSAVSGRGLIPKLEMPPILDRIFGGNNIDFKPNGFVTLDLGYLYQFIDNPAVAVRLRRQGNFIFNEQINLNFNGQIGERLGVLANFDTKASFNFENALKVNYRPQGLVPGLGANGLPQMPQVPGLPNLPTFGSTQINPQMPFAPQNESILQNVEVGNLTWNLNSQLIPGVQNLFGLKVQTRFGKLNATTVISQQRSRKQEIILRGGAMNRPFEIRADQYSENRHFFLSQFFRNNYERALKSLPVITSGVTVTRLEVYVTNRTNTTESLRNVLGFSDLAEPVPYNTANPNVQSSVVAGSPASNEANVLFSRAKTNADLRQIDRTSEVLTTTFGLQKGTDYDLLRGAKRLTEREFRFQPELGYISLITPLRNDEVLAVSYEYTYQGRHYQVGELTEDYQGQSDDKVLYLKLLKSSTIRNNLQNPMWNLMMKNIYSLNTTALSRQGFQLRIIYKDDVTGIDNPVLQDSELAGIPLVQVFNMDQLNQQLDRPADGNFDFVEGVTVDSRNGVVIFPVLEPFGSFLDRKLSQPEYKAKYVFNELYRTTLADAQQLSVKNKFFLRGSYQSSNGVPTDLPYGVKEQSVQVSAGGVPLVAGQDYVIEAQRLRFLNESIANSGREIRITYELPDLFQNQIRTLIGGRFDYRLAPDINVGFTAMNMRETPAGFLTRVAIGNEPVNNTMLGADINLRRDAPGLTRLLDRLPLIQTKEPSAIQFTGEAAEFIPGLAKSVNNNAFIDDFEATRTIFDLTRQPIRWRLGATPQNFPQGTFAAPLEYAYRRARISVYNVDQTLGLPGGTAGINVNLTAEDLNNVNERFFLPTSIFPGRSARQIQLPENVLDIAYFPDERGMYNYNPNLTSDGKLPTPRQNFGAVTRAVSSDNDFDNANIENITFWMMDPFTNDPVRGTPDPAKNKPNKTGGILRFNLGDISEDVIKDGRYNFENGLPIDTTNIRNRGVDVTPWGNAPRQQFVTNAFTNQAGAREKQDIGLDGLNNEQERAKFKPYLDAVAARVTDAAAKQQILDDPSNDDFRYYLGEQADSVKYIVARYKQYMGMQNNSPENANNLNQYTTPANSILPDIEDLNADNTINEQEAYYEYDVPLQPGRLDVGNGYIIDKVNAEGVNWYLFRVPIRTFARKFGNINGFKSIRFMRVVLTDFQEPVVLRFAQLQMEANQYRKYTGDLTQRGLQEVPEPYDAQFKVSAVNIEENSQTNSNKYTYSVPPGFIRDRDYTQINDVALNEQSMALAVTNLRDGDSRGAFKNTSFDFLFRDRLKMFIHMHSPDKSITTQNGPVSAFIRIGTDYTENYYEIEVPGLMPTPEGTNIPEDVWPYQNELDLAFQELIDLKAARNSANGRASGIAFTRPSSENGRYILSVVGNPDLSSVQSIMIGVRNPKSADEQTRTFTVWVDELRAVGINQKSGYAMIGAANVRLADLATITASGRYTTYGFGGVQIKPSERTREFTTEYGLTAAVALDKFTPDKWGLKIPMYVNYDTRRVTPQFNPLDPDTPLETSLASLPDGVDKNLYRRLVEDVTVRQGINFSNVRKIRTNTAAIPHPWDIENFGFNYAFNNITRSNILTGEYLQEQYRGGFTYTFASQPKPFEPFRNVKGLERKYLYWLHDFNLTLLPTLVSFRTDMDRSFIKTQLRNADLTTNGIPAQFEKYFLFNRYYDITWNLTKALVLTYKAAANSIIDEPQGDINTQTKRDSVWRNVQNLGRMKNYVQSFNATYRVPFDKFPVLNWITADVGARTEYQFQANSYGIKDSLNVPFGNTIRNTRDINIQGRVDLVLLYNKIKALRLANTPSPARLNFARNPGSIQDINPGGNRLTKAFVRALLTVRGINVTYNLQEGTILPGFLRSPAIFGLDQYGAPGLPFVLGSQDAGIAERAAQHGWLSPSIVQNAPFTQTITRRFTASTTLEPFRDFRLVVNANYNRGDNYQVFYRPALLGAGFSYQNPVRSGSYSMSYLSFGTTFEGLRADNTSPIFDRFEAYRTIIKDRLNADNPVAKDNQTAYDNKSQDVLIPAFFAAYSGANPYSVKYSPFYSIPFPNWDLNYQGLTKLKPFQKLFTSFNVTHRYTSNYSVGNFVSSLSYEAQYVNLAISGYPLSRQLTTYGQFIPAFVMSTITMSERFEPFLGVNFQTRSRLTGSLTYNRAREAGLNLSNAQVAEVTTKDITGSLGFTKKNIRLPFLVNGAVKRLKNDLTFQCALTLRDTRTIQRKLDAEQTIVAGNVNFQLRPQISYVVNSRLSLNAYFDRSFNDPLVTNSFIRATTAGGIQARFNLAQ